MADVHAPDSWSITACQVESLPTRQRVLLEVVAPYADALATPCDVVLVLDTSTSMRGHHLAAVQQSVLLIMEELGDEDRVGLVTFCRDASLVRPCSPLHGERVRMRHLVEQLSVAHGTHLEAGLRLALDVLPAPDPARARALIVLSDGHISYGMAHPEELIAMLQAHPSGAPTICSLGYGKNHDEHILHGLAHATHGIYRYIEQSAEAARHFGAVLLATRMRVARQVVLRVQATAGCLHGLAATCGEEPHVAQQDASLLLGAMLSMQRELIVIEASAEATLSYTLEADGGRLAQASLAALERGDATRDEDSWLTTLSACQRRAVRLAMQGSRASARAHLAHALERVAPHLSPGRSRLTSLCEHLHAYPGCAA